MKLKNRPNSFPQVKCRPLILAASRASENAHLRKPIKANQLKYNAYSSDLKTVDCNRSMSSNPIASAIFVSTKP
jgi:hypothetical protein